MYDTHLNAFDGQRRGNWILLRTIILLRWGAIVGQLSAILVAQKMFRLDLELGLCLLMVSVLIIANLIAIFIFPENKRLSETENLMMLLFDLLQLGGLLFLTGGLHNPFSILLVGPVTVSASVLAVRSTVFLATVAITIASLLAWFYIPLRGQHGFVMEIPSVFLYGHWVAIVIAVLFSSAYSRRVVSEIYAMSSALSATQMALAREQKLTDLGGVVAAAAHELGTPLATIKLASAEMIDELDDHPDLQDDARLIRDQADRCRDILHSMGRTGKDDLHLRRAVLIAVLEEAAEPHLDRGKEVRFGTVPCEDCDPTPPEVFRHPEIVHGLRNLIQNAVDFADTMIWVESAWTHDTITVRIMDDGHGYPVHILGRIGEPFISSRSPDGDPDIRPEYAGMGLGLFIAKTLLERSGAHISFANGGTTTDGFAKGANIEITWPRDKIDAQRIEGHINTAKNPFNEI